MSEIITFIVDIVWNLGYTWIFIMMVIESSFIPFPSEVAMIPAGYLASIWEMNFVIAFISGTLWALTWASINYFLWNYFWEKVIKKMVKNYGKYFLLSEKNYEKSELYFQKHGSITTFTGRFIPAIRQLISIPAGIFKMNLKKFYFYTFLWAWFWNLTLMYIGFIAGKNQELIHQYSREASIFLLIGIVILVWTYVSIHYRKLWKLKN